MKACKGGNTTVGCGHKMVHISAASTEMRSWITSMYSTAEKNALEVVDDGIDVLEAKAMDPLIDTPSSGVDPLASLSRYTRRNITLVDF